MNIQDLPTEVLNDIIGSVAEYDELPKVSAEDDDLVEDYSDLVQICLVSHRFRDLAQPF